MSALATLLRPNTLDDFVGQEHLVGIGKPLRISLEKNHVFSMILWGPPGVGKTTLARIFAHHYNRQFFELSAVSAGKADVRKIIQDAENFTNLLQTYTAPILFLDEIHRFNKAQQDYLLPFVESGQIILIGATTENPSFEVNSALLSRTKVFVLKQLTADEIKTVIAKALRHFKKFKKNIIITKETEEWLINFSNGDARKILNILEQTFELYTDISLESVKNTVQSQHLNYDKKGDQHYDTISAFIKSMRASNTDAALYYLARMVAAGEDPKFIARRMIIFASEDIGLAAPTALVVANTVFDAVTKIGYPEAQINLAHGVAYLSQCKKDRSAYDAYFAALADVEKFGNLPIPMELRNAPTKLMKKLDYSKGYEMYSKKSLLPEKLRGKQYLKSK